MDISKVDIGKLFMVGIYGTELNEENMTVLRNIKPGFIIFFSRNIETPEKLTKFISDISNFVGYKPVFSVDQEGGYVARLNQGFSVLPSHMACASTKDPDLISEGVSVMAKEMKAVGIDWNLAPVVDVNRNPYNPVIGIRSFSDDVQTVVQYGNLYVSSCEKAGIKTCLKHFPGLGDVFVDPHFSLPIVKKSFEDLLKEDLEPFLKIRCDSWMPTHINLPLIQTKELPASLSKEILTNLARETLNYTGLLVADDLLMGGVNKFEMIQRLILSFEAGMDVLTICHEPESQLRSFEQFCEWVMNNKNAKLKISQSLDRINKFISTIEQKRLPLSIVGSDEHKETMRRIYEKSITIVNSKNMKLPVDNVDFVISMLAPPGSPVTETSIESVPYIAKKIAQHYNSKIDLLTDKNRLNMYEYKGKNVILISFDAYKNAVFKKFIAELDKICDLIIISMRNPYDSFLGSNSITTYGALIGQQNAVFDMLVGKFTPVGILPIDRYKAEEVII